MARIRFVRSGLAAMPSETETLPQENLIRFCFSKQDGVLRDALGRLQRYLG